MAWKPALKNSLRKLRCLSGNLGITLPKTMHQNITPRISPFTAAANGFNGIIRIIISNGELGVDSDSGSNSVAIAPRSMPTPGLIKFAKVSPITIAKSDVSK